MCPGHYDLKPADVEALSHAGVVLLHDWQLRMGNVQRVLEAAKTPDERIHVIAVEGNWLAPETQASAVQAIAEVLAEEHAEQPETYASNARAFVDEVREHGEGFRAAIEKAGLPGTRVLCNVMQTPFAEWMGLEVAASFRGGADLSAAEIDALVERAKAADVVLVVDNLQSGSARLSETLARETGTPRVVLSNFPGAFADTPDWASTVARNVELLVEAMETQHE
jgi:zinc transport system substrate-binding protein